MITKYINYLSNVAGYSQNTCKAYESDLRAFAVWAKIHTTNGRWSCIKQSDIEAYISHLTKQGYEAASTNRALSSIRSLYRWWQRQGLITANPAKNVLPRLEPKNVPTTISTEKLHAIYQAADEETRLIIAILYCTGIRVSELLSIRWQDVNLENGSILINGKGNKQRYVYVGNNVIEGLRKRLSGRNWKGVIFQHSQRTIRRMLTDALHAAGKEGTLSPHVLRHTIATQWAKNGASNTAIAKALGHARLETSNKYIDLAQISAKPMMLINSMFN